MVYPMAVLALCSFLFAGCAKESVGPSWAEDKDSVADSIKALSKSQEIAESTAQIEHIKLNKQLKDLETVNRTQQAQIDALTARIEKLHRKRKVVAKPVAKKKPEAAVETQVAQHRTTPVKAPELPPVAVKRAVVINRAAHAEEEKNAYTSAYLALKSGRFDEASKGFNEQLDAYPQGEYADQAWYWLGEARLAQQALDNAHNAFKYVADHYPESVKHASALLKLGQLSEMEEKNGAAIEYYSRLIKQHPESSLAEQAREALVDLQQSSGVEQQQ